ncbi:MAG TPA: hypothetical protein VFA81_11285 [Burkholderiales bacterium]|nr:hypothetical protein [Burkholderiales bacterium]
MFAVKRFLDSTVCCSSMRSLLANWPLAMAKSRTWRALTTAEHSPRAANSPAARDLTDNDGSISWLYTVSRP